MYALIKFAGKQFRVEEGDSIKVPYVDCKVGSKVLTCVHHAKFIDYYANNEKDINVLNSIVKDFGIERDGMFYCVRVDFYFLFYCCTAQFQRFSNNKEAIF